MRGGYEDYSLEQREYGIKVDDIPERLPRSDKYYRDKLKGITRSEKIANKNPKVVLKEDSDYLRKRTLADWKKDNVDLANKSYNRKLNNGSRILDTSVFREAYSADPLNAKINAKGALARNGIKGEAAMKWIKSALK